MIKTHTSPTSEQTEDSTPERQLGLLEKFAAILSKLDPDLCYSSGIKYKSELDDCGHSVDGHVRGNGWQIRIYWDNEVHLLWSPNLRALLEGAIKFLEDRVTLDIHA